MSYVFGEIWPLLLAALLVGLLIGWLCRRCFAGSADAELRASIGDRDARIAELESSLGEREARVASLTGDVERLGADAAALAAARGEVESLRSRVGGLEAEARRAADLEAELARANAAVESATRDAEGRVQALTADLESARSSTERVAELEASLAAAEESARSARGEAERAAVAGREVEALRARVLALEGERDAARRAEEQAASTIASLESDLSTARAAASAAGAAEALRTRVAGLESELSAAQREAGAAGDLRARITDLEGSLATARGEAGQVGGLRSRIADLEARLAAGPTLDVVEGGKVLGSPLKLDDLTVVEGIGPAIGRLFADAGIRTWRQLADTSPGRLKEILDAAGPSFAVHDPGTWPRQAGLLAEGRWTEFAALTAELDAGRPREAAPAAPDVAEGARVLGGSVKLDDLKLVEGIGPRIEELCHAIGIRTWRALSETSPARLREMLEEAGPRFRMHDPETWPTQAGLLADGRWAEFATLTETLRGGREAG